MESDVYTKDGRPAGTPAVNDFEHSMSVERYTYMSKELDDFFKNKSVYCPGCGWGAAEKHIANLGAKRVIGVDFNPTAIKLAKKSYNVPGVTEYVQEDITSYFPNENIDIICAVEIVEHVTDIELDSTLRLWFDKLNSGGILYITTPERRHNKSDYPMGSHFTEFDYEELMKIVESYGFIFVGGKRKQETDGISMALMFLKS